MSVAQQESHLKNFHEAEIITEGHGENPSSSNSISQADEQSSTKEIQLSIDVEKSGVKSVPAVVLKAMSQKAVKLLSDEGSVVQAPGCRQNAAFMVESTTSKKPHYVSLSKNGKVTCEGCPGWKALNICAHALAAAEKAGTLASYTKWLSGKGPNSMNVTCLVTCNSSSATGKKGGKASTARRKGGRTVKLLPATTIVDRPTFANSLSQCVTSASTVQQVASQVVSSPALHIATSLPGLPSPITGIFVVQLLQFCPPLVQSCHGCYQCLKPEGGIPCPPYDLVIVSRMPRAFRPYPIQIAN